MKLIELENDCPVDISLITKQIKVYFNLTYINYLPIDKTLNNLIQAKQILDSCRLLVKNMIEPELERSNDYVRDKIDLFKLMNENIGRYDRLTFDDTERDIIRTLEIKELSNTSLALQFNTYLQKMNESMEALVYFPLYKATKKFYSINETPNGEPILKDEDLFCYYIFLEMFHASEFLGIVTKEKSDKQRIETIQHDLLPEIPGNVRVQNAKEEAIARAEAAFNAPLIS